ncbi:MAG: hypothetical protein HIU89_10460 [Proteobacteria bacterium]|nr:hypothetical protein [Pseudomonadota bacterium]
MKNSSGPDGLSFDGDNAEAGHRPHLPSDSNQASDAREEAPTNSNGSPLPPQDSNAAHAGKLSKYRTSVKMLEQHWESEKTIRSTTRARNMEVFDIVQRRAIKEIAKGDPEVEIAITMPRIIEHFIADTMDGHYSKPSYARYRTALMSEMNIQLRTLSEAGEMAEYIEAMAILSQKTYRPNTIFDANLAMEHTGPKKKVSEKGIGRAAFKTIIRELEDRGERGAGALLWARATMITGLRPVEWEQSKLDEDGKLHTSRAKTHRHIAAFERMNIAKKILGRDVKNVYEADDIIIEAMGEMPIAHVIEHRILELEGGELEIVKRHVANVERECAKGEDGFDKYQHACTKYLHRVCKSVWKGEKLYSLYSFRHQFSANAKRVMSLNEVKFTLGSNSATKYAPRSQSWKGLEGAGNYHRPLDAEAQRQQEAAESGAEWLLRPG